MTITIPESYQRLDEIVRYQKPFWQTSRRAANTVSGQLEELSNELTGSMEEGMAEPAPTVPLGILRAFVLREFTQYEQNKFNQPVSRVIVSRFIENLRNRPRLSKDEAKRQMHQGGGVLYHAPAKNRSFLERTLDFLPGKDVRHSFTYKMSELQKDYKKFTFNHDVFLEEVSPTFRANYRKLMDSYGASTALDHIDGEEFLLAENKANGKLRTFPLPARFRVGYYGAGHTYGNDWGVYEDIGGTIAGVSARRQQKLNLPKLSREHCELRLEDGKRVIYDLGSRTGTYVNGERISEERKTGSRMLNSGDVIGLIPNGNGSFLLDIKYEIKDSKPREI